MILPIPSSFVKAFSNQLIKSGVKISQLAAKFFPTAARTASRSAILKEIATISGNIRAIEKSIDIWKTRRNAPAQALINAETLLKQNMAQYAASKEALKVVKQKAKKAQDDCNSYFKTICDTVAPPSIEWPGDIPFWWKNGKFVVSKHEPIRWPGGQAGWLADRDEIGRRLFNLRKEVDKMTQELDQAEAAVKNALESQQEATASLEAWSKKIKEIDEKIKLNKQSLFNKRTEKSVYDIDLEEFDEATDLATKLNDFSGKYGLDRILTDIFMVALGSLGYFGVVDKHQCRSGVQLNEDTCKCDICPDGKELCDTETWWTEFRGNIIQLPFERVSDEENFCLDPCSCGNFYDYTPGDLTFPGLCSCKCIDKYQNPNDTDPITYELKPCNKSECGFGSEIGEFCTTKYPPDDPYGNMVARYPDWQGRYFWNQSRCEWVEKTCEDILFGGVQIGGEFIPGRTSMGNGTCKYNVTCYACDECPNGRTLELSKSEAEGKSCSELSNDELKLFSSCGECPNSSSSSSSSPEIVDCWVCFEGEVESPDSGPQNLRRTKKECDSRPGGAGTQAREDLDCCKSSEGRWVKACADSEEKCANCPYGHDDNCQCVCPEVVFGGKTYQGTYDEQSNDCKYNVQCFQCDNTFSSFNDFEQADCEIVNAELTKKQIDQKPNCNDWSVVDRGREIKRWNSCAEADCKSSSSSSSCG